MTAFFGVRLTRSTAMHQSSLHSGSIDGISIVPLLRNPSARLNRDALFFHFPHYYATTSPVSAVRAREWKLLEYHEDGRLELFNLAKDQP